MTLADVFRENDPIANIYSCSMSRMKKERSCSGGTFEFQPSSPSSSRKHLSSKEKSSTTSTSRLRYLQHANVPLVDLTIFHIPGLDVKVTTSH